jgi:hypothetical protein
VPHVWTKRRRQPTNLRRGLGGSSAGLFPLDGGASSSSSAFSLSAAKQPRGKQATAWAITRGRRRRRRGRGWVTEQHVLQSGEELLMWLGGGIVFDGWRRFSASRHCMWLFCLGVPQFQSLLRWPTTNRWPTTSGGSRKRSASAVGRCASRCTMRWRRMRTASGATNAFLPRGSVSARTKAHGAAGIPANECTCSIPTGNSAIRYRGGSNRAWSSASQMTRGEEQ